MTTSIGIIGMGAMGAGVAARLVSNGLEVRTSIKGRGAETKNRATKAGVRLLDLGEVCKAQIVLSIVPPAEAMNVALEVAAALKDAKDKPIFVDCNAISVDSVKDIAVVMRESGIPFVDGGIIGFPPSEKAQPTLYVAGEHASRVAELSASGLNVRPIDGPIGSASALKMSYAGINKGMVMLISSMILAADRAGAAGALKQELSVSRPELIERMNRSIPDMFSKAARWAPEMEEISEFTKEDKNLAAVFESFSEICKSIAGDYAGPKKSIAVLADFTRQP